MNALDTFNHALFLKVNAGLSTPPWVITAARLLANQLIYLIPLALISLWCWGGQLQRSVALKALVAMLAALALNQIIGVIWPTPRPFVLGIGHTFFSHAPSPSFPSNHAVIFWSVGLVLIASNRRSLLGWVILATGASVAWARVFLGVHFPLDMLGALVVAGLVCLVINPVWRLIERSIMSAVTRIYLCVFAYPITKGWFRG